MCSNWTKPELEDTLEDVVNELEFVRLVLDSKDQEKCNWYETRANELWESDCGIEYLTNTDGQAPCDCGFKFCPFCGKPIIENIIEPS